MSETFKLSLDDVEPWKGSGVILNPGVHPIRVVEEEIKLDGDHPVVLLTLEAIGGEEQGGEIRDWVHVTEKTLGRIAQIYEAFAVDVPAGEFEWIPVKGKQAKAVVRNVPGRDDPSKTFSEVKSYVALASGDEVASEIEAGFEGAATRVDDDKDIPF